MNVKKLILFLISSAIIKTSFCQDLQDSALLLPKEDMQWWQDAKVGLFVHYGLYSIPGKGEWYMFTDRIDVDKYKNLKDRFECEKFNAYDWVATAKNSGCKYMVVTTRHHDGFCLFDTKFGDFDAVNSKVGKDLIAEYSEAAHKENIRLGYYYSPLDWRYPGFFFPNMFRSSAEELKRQTYTQVKELLTNYGKVDILWYDGGGDNWLGLGGLNWEPGKNWHQRNKHISYEGDFSWEPLKLNRMVRDLQPQIIINERSGWMGDFTVQEGSFKERSDRPFEVCTNLSGHPWGWVPDAKDNIMELDSLIRLLVKVVCNNGNLLLNVGPKANGEIEMAQVNRLNELGEFLSKYGESIYNTRGGVYADWGGTTVKDNAIYVHILRLPFDGSIHLPPNSRNVESVFYLCDGTDVDYIQSNKGLVLKNIEKMKHKTDLILKIILK